MFNFKHGVKSVVKSLATLANSLGLHVSAYYDETQVAVSNYDWNILADFEELYVCSSNRSALSTLKICRSKEEVEQEFLDLLQQVANQVK